MTSLWTPRVTPHRVDGMQASYVIPGRGEAGNSSGLRVKVDIIFPFSTLSIKPEESTCYVLRQRNLRLPGETVWNGGLQKRAAAGLLRVNVPRMFLVLRKPRAKPY